MARLGREHFGDMSTEGDRVRTRRERLGMDKRGLAEAAGVNRNTLSAVESGDSFNRSTLTKIERALDEAEREAGIDAPPAVKPEPTSAPRMVVVRIKSEHGEVVVEGPVEDIATLREEALALLRGMAQPGDS